MVDYFEILLLTLSINGYFDMTTAPQDLVQIYH